MATIKPVILKKTNKDGNCKVQIAISHKQKTAYIVTDIIVDPTKFVNGKLVEGKGFRSINAEILALTNKYSERLNNIENIGAYDVVQLKELIRDTKTKYTMVSEAFKVYKDSVKSQNSKDGVDKGYNALMRYTKGKDVTLASITPDFVKKFKIWMESNNSRKNSSFSSQTIRNYIGYLRTAIRNAVKHGMVKYDIDPFIDYNAPKVSVRNNSISVDTFNIIRNHKCSRYKQQVCKDMFLLSFYLGGMNMVDIMKIDFRSTNVTYTRQKVESSNTPITIKIFPQAREIIDKYIGKDGLLNLPYKGDNGLKAFLGLVNDRFLKKTIKETYGIDEYITFYSARKCFAQIGINIGISDNIINYILGHSPGSRGVISHYSSVMPSLGEEAMRMIFDFVDRPEDIKEIFRRNILKQLNG